jgi:alcohol dehydrogenase
MMLPSVVRFNGAKEEARRAYGDLAAGGQISGEAHDSNHAVEALAGRLEVLLGLAGIPASLAECGVERARIPLLAEEAARQWTAAFNPRPASKEDFVTLYEAAFQAEGG